jgi:hypothetical protein
MLRSKTTNDPASRFSLNTAEGRRARDLYEAFVIHMGSPVDTVRLSHALAAAELVVASETARAELLAGRGDVEQLIRLENLAARATKRLGITDAAAAPAPPPAPLADWAASHAQDAPQDAEDAPSGPAAETRHEGPQAQDGPSGEDGAA